MSFIFGLIGGFMGAALFDLFTDWLAKREQPTTIVQKKLNREDRQIIESFMTMGSSDHSAITDTSQALESFRKDKS